MLQSIFDRNDWSRAHAVISMHSSIRVYYNAVEPARSPNPATEKPKRCAVEVLTAAAPAEDAALGEEKAEPIVLTAIPKTAGDRDDAGGCGITDSR